MRAALISVGEQPVDHSGGEVRVAGKSIACRQAEFALEAGCSRVFALGDARSPGTLRLRQIVEDGGAEFRAISSIRGLLGVMSATDELLLVAPGLLADEAAASSMLRSNGIVLVLPAASAVPVGFERIDLERAWAGAAIIPGSLVERLSELPEDFDATSALLRIALQARVPEGQMPETAMTEGRWVVVRDDDDVASIGQAWLDRRLRSRAGEGLSPWLAGELLGLWAEWLLERKRSFALIIAGAVALLIGAVASAWYGYASIGFAGIALAALAIEVVTGMIPLLETRRHASSRKLVVVLRAVTDLAIFGCLVMDLHGEWLHRLFPPSVLMLALHLRVPAIWPDAVRVLGDRVVIALLLAAASVFSGTEPAVMALALAMLILKSARLGGNDG